MTPVWIDLKRENYRIADIPKPKREEKPAHSGLLGMYDSRASEETVGPSFSGSGEKGEKRKKIVEERSFGFSSPAGNPSGNGGSESLPEDFFPDFRRGSHTYLNVHRFPDVDYFIRLKRAFRMTWDPVRALRSDYSLNQISSGVVEVALGVSVKAGGELAEAFVLRSSGLEAYDREALRTVQASAPFSSPPSKLLDREKLLRMGWTFSFYL